MPIITKISPAQIVAAISFIVGQAVAYGLLTSQQEQLIVSLATIVLPGILMIADAIIHHAYARIQVATIASEAQKAAQLLHFPAAASSSTITSHSPQPPAAKA